MNADFRQLLHDLGVLVSDFYHSRKSYLSLLLGVVVGFLAAIIMGAAFYELFDALREKELGSFDDKIIGFAVGMRNPWFTDLMLFVTELGDRWAFILATVLLFIFFYLRYRSFIFPLQTALVLLVAGGLNRWLKALIDRPRPDAHSLLEETSLSFPSGHAMGSIAFYGFLIYLTWRLTPKNPGLRWVISVFLVFLILAIGFSRIYLGVHYPSDVLAGFSAGGACLTIFIAIFSYIRYRYARKGIEIRVTSKEQEIRR